jgi:ABC-type transport system substrate-binding protein
MRSIDPLIVQLLTEARQELDPVRRTEMYQRFNRWLDEEQPVTLLAHQTNTLLLHKRFQSVAPSPIHGVFPRDWWVDPKDVLHEIGR